MPAWAKRAVDEWINVSAIGDGPIFRRVNRVGKVWGEGSHLRRSGTSLRRQL
jgi:hypothetical protein